jgi:hypothetical protein
MFGEFHHESKKYLVGTVWPYEIHPLHPSAWDPGAEVFEALQPGQI